MSTVTTPATTTSVTAAPARRRGRGATVTLWVLQVLAAAIFVFASAPKLLATPQAVEGFEAIGFGVPGMYVIGVLELLGAIGLLIPRLCGLAATAFIGLMVGAVVVTVLTGPALLALPAVTLVLVSGIAWARRDNTAALIASLRRG